MSAHRSGEPNRRSTHVEHDVAYAAVGASVAADLMRFPPEGSAPYASELRLGSGAERFLLASSALMTWGAQRGAGMEVEEIEHGDGQRYAGVAFDERGTPQPVAETETHYGPDGDPFLSAGTTAAIRIPGESSSRRVRVVSTVNEPQYVGFAWGSIDDAGAIGEEAFAVEWRDDDTVWATVQGFLYPRPGGIARLRTKAAVRIATGLAERQLASLVPGVLNGERRSTGPDEDQSAGPGEGRVTSPGEGRMTSADE
ncbi:DUF1990 family protein [Leucobacter weissii]|uniref:DUF1990 family protein n=1 Tax=Leucobacter weissii TaxID=1983706 RepID=A0A939MK06_9MICO|nr:DUF1990 family protein [Leucobacter weissii]